MNSKPRQAPPGGVSAVAHTLTANDAATLALSVAEHHCATCQPHDHVIDAACADCGDGPLITGQPTGPRAGLATPARLANPP